MKLSSVELRRLAALPAEALPDVLALLAAKAFDEELEEADRLRAAASAALELERAKERERKRAYRGTKAGQSRDIDGTLTGQVEESPPSLFPPHTPPITLPPLPTEENKTRARGTRLPDGFYPSLETIDKLTEELGPFPDGFILRESNKFRDYWKARAGAGGVKLDWPATFRNWIRKAAEQLPRARGAPPAPRETGINRAIRERAAEIEEEQNGKRSSGFSFDEPA